MQKNDYLDKLNEEQRAAVVHEGSPLLILAGAGSGKTRVITTKIAYLISEKNIDPWSILSVTFTKKAANEMRERAVAIDERAADAQIRTFHSFGSWFLRKYAEHAGLEPSFTVYDDDDVAKLMKDIAPDLKPKEISLVCKQISLAKDYFLTPEDDLSSIGSEFDLNDLYSKYQKQLRGTGNVDFGDLIMLPVQVMQAYPEVADYIHNRFKVIMVDEYQDSNIAQYKLLQELSGVKQGCDTYVCVVGDDDQSIYKFRGAEVENILTFPEKFPGTEIIKLERNYRSTGNILKAASLVVRKNEGRLGKTLVAEREDGMVPMLTFLPDYRFETKFVYELIHQSVESNRAKYSDWAVFYRTNAQSRDFENILVKNRIPYTIYGSLKFLEREEIKDALAYISFFSNHKDIVAFKRIINKPSRGIGDKAQKSILEKSTIQNENGDVVYQDLLESLEKSLPGLSKKATEGANAFLTIYKNLEKIFTEDKSLSFFIENVIHYSGLAEHYSSDKDKSESEERLENLEKLIDQDEKYKCTKTDLSEFLDTIALDRSISEKVNDSDDRVVLSTLHNTKGLEFNRVVITGLEEGVFPRTGKVGAEIEEERRLFYVGITRARNELYLTSTSRRFMYGHEETVAPSRFIRESIEAFSIQGNAPFGFSRGIASSRPAFGKSGIPGGTGSGSSANSGYYDDTDGLSAKWKKGVKVFHDDYGYGMIINAHANSGEYVIEVQFENGGKKKFLPKYQAKSLEIINVDL